MYLKRWVLALAMSFVMAGCGNGGSNGADGEAGPDDDADSDFISNADEGFEDLVNTDADTYPDYLDYDSDGDGILDSFETGDSDLDTPPVDSDEDGIPDFRDLDSDNDNIDDTTELDSDFAPVDTDGDGIYDHLDTESDGDTITDADEGAQDCDGDGSPNFRDDDSDGDGIPDSIEAGDADPATPPIDTDNDGTPNFLDLDSDNDYLPDADEDLNGNGVVDPGESSPVDSDTDGDGIPDLVENMAGSDPSDPDDTIPPGDFYFVLPYQGPGAEGPLDFTTTVRQADIFFSMDTTGSFGEEIEEVSSALEKTIVPGIVAVIDDTGFGVGRFEDMPLEPFGLPGDKPYELLQEVTTDISLVSDGLSLLPPAEGGLDIPEAGFEALYQWASGVGIPELGYMPFAPPGIGGVGFRESALPIIVQITDAISHSASDYFTLIPGAHSKEEAIEVLQSIGARVIGIDSLENVDTPEDPRAQLEEMAIATKAIIPPDVDTGKCHMGVDGSQIDPVDVDGDLMCPIVFDVLPDGSGIGTLIVDAVVQLATLGVLDISTETVGRTEGQNGETITIGYTTADFIKSVTPVPPPPEGAEISGNFFLHVTPGSTVIYQVEGFNDFQPSTEFDQLFIAEIEVLGDLVTVLDVRTVYIIVPKTLVPPPI